MISIKHFRAFTFFVAAMGTLLCAQPSLAQDVPPQYPDYPSETPAKLVPKTDSFDYTRTEVMIPMRDGVKLHTVILVPKGAKRAPMLLTRTPYDANAGTSHAQSSISSPLAAFASRRSSQPSASVRSPDTVLKLSLPLIPCASSAPDTVLASTSPVTPSSVIPPETLLTDAFALIPDITAVALTTPT